MRWNVIKTAFGHINKSGATIANLGAWIALLTVVITPIAKSTKPFVDQGWGWADAVLIGLAGAVCLAIIAAGLYLAYAIALWMIWRVKHREPAGLVRISAKADTDEDSALPSRIEDVANIAGEAMSRAQAAEVAGKATASHAASINEGHLDLKRRFEEATKQLEDRIRSLEDELKGFRYQIQLHDEKLTTQQAVARQLDSLERYEEAKARLDAIRAYKQKLGEVWPGMISAFQKGDPKSIARRTLYTMGPMVSLPVNTGPLSAYYANLSAEAVPAGSPPDLYAGLEYYQRQCRALDEGTHEALEVIKAYEEDRRLRLDPNRPVEA